MRDEEKRKRGRQRQIDRETKRGRESHWKIKRREKEKDRLGITNYEKFEALGQIYTLYF